MAEQLRVLLLAGNQELNLLRSHILELAGYRTETPSSTDAAAMLIQGGPFHALVVCHSLSEDEALQLTKSFRAANPKAPIIGITTSRSKPLWIPADKWVHNMDGPRMLLEALADATSR